ncbi:MAG: YihY family inner membrane protein, partial [Bdellovibrionales bacterium]|nr:YihY family inner membrane protein [Bdellovibrionales bacterium]
MKRLAVLPADWLVSFGQSLGQAVYRFYWDDCFSRASALAYTTLLSLVPLVALTVSVFTAFGFDESEFQATLRAILEQVLPPMQEAQISSFQEQVVDYLLQFSNVIRIGALNAISVGVLIFTGVALLNTIESALNVIWRVSSSLPLFSKLTRFWAAITIGPVLIAISIYWTAKVRSLSEEAGFLAAPAMELANVIIPVTGSWLALTLLFATLPAARVRLHDAALGGMVSALLFEGVKRGFAHYLTMTATYNRLYGVLVGVPLFLVWLYITWCVVLLGAELAYMLGTREIRTGRKKYATDLGEIGALVGIRILHLIGSRFLAGEEPPTDSELARETGTDPVLIRACLDLLTDA